MILSYRQNDEIHVSKLAQNKRLLNHYNEGVRKIKFDDVNYVGVENIQHVE